ncbi:MAG: radical SAM protein [Aquabacterium sp.]
MKVERQRRYINSLDSQGQAKEALFHVSVLSNFARGFDKYSCSYSKADIPESTYPDQFFLLRKDELEIGIEKARRLLDKLNIPGNGLLVLETSVASESLRANTRTGLGRYIESDRIQLKCLHQLNETGELVRIELEDATAWSLALNEAHFASYTEIRPRTISFLPIAQACQARCAFCFSKASISSQQKHAEPDWLQVEAWLTHAKRRGAERAVITGGGEPTLLPPDDLVKLVGTCKEQFDKIVLITNGHALATLSPKSRMDAIKRLHAAGLSVMAISRHHFDDTTNTQLMGLSTPIEALAQTWLAQHASWPALQMRLICVLQKGGIDSFAALSGYLDWAAQLGITEICFKELYVSTSSESVYHDRQSNAWCRSHQVPLSLLTAFLVSHDFSVESRLPWGAPVFAGQWRGKSIKIAAYTEPSLFWERSHGIARSWNVLADGRAYVSLEDKASEVRLEQFR